MKSKPLLKFFDIQRDGKTYLQMGPQQVEKSSANEESMISMVEDVQMMSHKGIDFTTPNYKSSLSMKHKLVNATVKNPTSIYTKTNTFNYSHFMPEKILPSQDDQFQNFFEEIFQDKQIEHGPLSQTKDPNLSQKLAQELIEKGLSLLERFLATHLLGASELFF